MATYDLQTVTAVPAAQFDGTAASLAAIQAICPDARMDPTNDSFVRVPLGGSHGTVRTMYKNEWIFAAVTGQFIVMQNTTFTTLFTPTP